ncbi:hypothetical protein S83_002328, partial [Arachis hypogaea]
PQQSRQLPPPPQARCFSGRSSVVFALAAVVYASFDHRCAVALFCCLLLCRSLLFLHHDSRSLEARLALQILAFKDQ